MTKHTEFEHWLQSAADDLQPETVPEWSRESTFRQMNGTQPLSWWQRPWLPLSALAVSACALLLVIGQVQFSQTGNGFTVRFGGGVDPAAVESLVEQRLADYQAEQKIQLANYASTLRSDFREDFRAELTTVNQQLVNYVLATSRDERQDDMADLIRYVNAQREDDQVYFANLLQQFSEDYVETRQYPVYPASQVKE